MKWLAAGVALLTIVIGTIALADDPGGHIQTAQDLLNQAQTELDAAIAEPQPTVTETVTETITETITPPPSTTTTTTPPTTCVGVQVAAGANLQTVLAGEPAGTVFCLDADTYTVGSADPILEDGDVIQGSGIDQTFIRPAGFDNSLLDLAPGSAVTVSDLDLQAPTMDPASTTCNSDCGRAFGRYGNGITLRDVRCHDAGTTCIGGGGQTTARNVLDNVTCDHNGSHLDSLRSDFRSSACVKMNVGSLYVVDSDIVSNYFNGLWCDFCDATAFVVENSNISDNGARGIQWEVSGHFVAGDYAQIDHNVIQGNGWRRATTDVPLGGGCAGVLVSDAANITIEANTFGGNDNCSGTAFWAVRMTDGTRDPAPNENIIIRDNILNGDLIVSCTSIGVTCSGNV